jgi:predicted HD phosphohydrolase
MDNHDDRATFHDMSESTQEDWQIIMKHNIPFAQNGGKRILDHLKLLDGDFGGFAVDRLTHSLQTATRAHRDGRDEDYVVMALLHDIGDTLGSYNHPDIAAAIVKPFVDEKLHWMCEHHGIFQGYYFFHYLGLDRDMREQYRGHEHFEDTARFCSVYDQAAFDDSFASAPLEFFEPMVRRVFAAPKQSIYVTGAE